jgi:hypothetical protein
MCLSICFREPRESEFRPMAEDQTILQNDGGVLPTGSYFVVTSGLLPCLDIMLMGLDQPAQWMRVVLTEERARYRVPSPLHSRDSPNQSPIPRVLDIDSNLHSMLDSTFTFRVRTRDRHCMISNVDNSGLGYYGQQACHIIPRSQLEHVLPVFLCLIGSGSSITCKGI